MEEEKRRTRREAEEKGGEIERGREGERDSGGKGS